VCWPPVKFAVAEIRHLNTEPVRIVPIAVIVLISATVLTADMIVPITAANGLQIPVAGGNC
jgi:hypothetical protein